MQSARAAAPELRSYFTARLGADEEVTLEGPHRIAIGHSRAMLGVNVAARIGGHPVRREYVLRVEQGGVFGLVSTSHVHRPAARGRTPT